MAFGGPAVEGRREGEREGKKEKGSLLKNEFIQLFQEVSKPVDSIC